MDKRLFKQGMAMFVKSFPNKTFDSDIMWEFLKDLDGDMFIGAVSKLIMTTQDINSATNLVALIRDFAVPDKSCAGEAWAEVLKAISSVGSYGCPKFTDELIDQAVSCVGWRNMCMSENIAIERAHFLKIYDTIHKRKRVEMLTVSHDVKKMIKNITEKIG